MIVAVEGPSASGKTTWCSAHCGDLFVREAPENIAAPDLYADPVEVGRFWVDHYGKNWQRALAIEREHGIAVCDGDPFHLYFAWALWKSGALDQRLFEIERELYREAFENQQLGFVDVVLWLEAPMDELRQRARADISRKRKRHELYLALVPWMKDWFAARERLLPGTFRLLKPHLALQDLRIDSSSNRNSSTCMAQMIASL
jgi:GTPase SAR1 family protein